MLGEPEELKPAPGSGTAEILSAISTSSASAGTKRNATRGGADGAEALRREEIIDIPTFPLAEVPTAMCYARDRIDDAMKVIVRMR